MNPLDLFALISVGLVVFSFLVYWLVYRWEQAKRRPKDRQPEEWIGETDQQERAADRILVALKLAHSQR